MWPWRCRSPKVPGTLPPIRRVQIPHPLVEFLPEVGELDDLVIPLVGEMLVALGTGAVDVLAIEGELFLEIGRGELLGQDRRDVDGPLRRDPVGDQTVDDFQQRQVAFEGRLAQPVAPVRPPTVVDHHRKMSMENECMRVAH